MSGSALARHATRTLRSSVTAVATSTGGAGGASITKSADAADCSSPLVSTGPARPVAVTPTRYRPFHGEARSARLSVSGLAVVACVVVEGTGRPSAENQETVALRTVPLPGMRTVALK